MSTDLISWKTEKPKPTETLFDVLKNDNDAEAHAYPRAALEQRKAELEAEAAARLDNLSDSELLDQWQRAGAAEEAKTLPQRQVDAVLRFVRATPEFIPNLNNQNLIDTYLKKHKLDATQPEHFDEAYRVLSGNGLLDLDETKRVREPYKRMTTADYEAMSDEQLEAWRGVDERDANSRRPSPRPAPRTRAEVSARPDRGAAHRGNKLDRPARKACLVGLDYAGRIRAQLGFLAGGLPAAGGKILRTTQNTEDEMSANWGWFNSAVMEQLGPELAAGKHSEYPALKRIWLAEAAAKAERECLVQACFEVANGADVNWLKEN